MSYSEISVTWHFVYTLDVSDFARNRRFRGGDGFGWGRVRVGTGSGGDDSGWKERFS